MDSGFYAACTALMARSQTLDQVANNLANVSTPGYRAQHDSFRSVLATTSNMTLSGLNQAVNDYSIVGDGELDLSQGSLEKTGNDLDLGIQGKGFFCDSDCRRPGIYSRRQLSRRAKRATGHS
jgi:flagellar basal-body rod protein FlgF